jgi:hypothetical protein
LGCWGDPSDASYFGGHYYGQFLRAVYPTIKAANPSVNLMVGGLLLDCNPNLGLVRNEVLQTCTPARFLEGILASGARDSFDGVAFHAYDYFVKSANGDEWYENSNWASSWNTTGPATLAKASYLRDVLNRAGVTGKFLMNTEIGILCGLGGDGTCVNALRNSPLKTYYVVYSFISSMADGYPAAIWYSSTGDNRGNELINLQDQSPTPAFHAFKFMATKLQSAKYNAKLSLGSGVTAYEMIDNGKRIWVVWATDRQQHNVSLPLLPKEINRINTTGLPVSVSPSTNLVVTMAPVFIEFP